MDKMTNTLKVWMSGDTDVTLTRSFAAPAALVWRAVTEPALITQWLWARTAPMTLCEQDFRVGGAYRWVWRMPGGRDMAVSGRFVEIDAPRRLTHTEAFEPDWTGGETTVTQDFDEQAPRLTRMTMVIRCRSREARDGVLATNMTEGMEESYVKLDSLLTTLTAV
jgi:uncharacterized protein YndB with AHSA1/START domain